MRQIVLDTETTGLSPKDGHRIIEIGCVELYNRRLTGKHFHCYLQPDRPVDEGAVRVHGITNAFLEGKPRFLEIVKDFKAFIKDAELIIHNAPFDCGFLRSEFEKINDEWKAFEDFFTVIDTLAMARQKHPGQRNNLDALCTRYKVNNQHREKHGALLDAEILANVYLQMTSGQDALLLEESATKPTMFSHQDSMDSPKEIQSVPLMQANEEELKNHEEFLAFMEKTSRKIPNFKLTKPQS